MKTPRIDEEKEEECAVVMYIPFEVWYRLKKVLENARKSALYDNTKHNLDDLNSWLNECVQNYDGVPARFFSNEESVIDNKTGKSISLI